MTKTELMKYHIFVKGGIFLILIVVSCFSGSPVCAEYTLVFETFAEGWLNPRGLDDFIKANQSLYDSRYFICSRELKAKMGEIDRLSREQCQIHTDPNWYFQCLRENPGAGVPEVLSDLESVIQNGTPWLSTTSGRQAILTVQIYEYLIEDFKRDLYPQLAFVFGKQYADDYLQQQINAMKGPLLQYIEIMRAPLTCH